MFGYLQIVYLMIARAITKHGFTLVLRASRKIKKCLFQSEICLIRENCSSTVWGQSIGQVLIWNGNESTAKSNIELIRATFSSWTGLICSIILVDPMKKFTLHILIHIATWNLFRKRGIWWIDTRIIKKSICIGKSYFILLRVEKWN